jgi:hypothetical protein
MYVMVRVSMVSVTRMLVHIVFELFSSSKEIVVGLSASRTQPVHAVGAGEEAFVVAIDVELEILRELAVLVMITVLFDGVTVDDGLAEEPEDDDPNEEGSDEVVGVAVLADEVEGGGVNDCIDGDPDEMPHDNDEELNRLMWKCKFAFETAAQRASPKRA